jgi:hypothetical protein
MHCNALKLVFMNVPRVPYFDLQRLLRTTKIFKRYVGSMKFFCSLYVCSVNYLNSSVSMLIKYELGSNFASFRTMKLAHGMWVHCAVIVDGF